MNKKDWFNLPNGLTAVRILLAPALIAVFFASPADRQLPAMCLFIAAGITDFLDGYFARRLNQVTGLGKILDPIADKLMSAAALVCLVCADVLPWFLLGVIVAKELYMAVGASLCLKNGLEVASDIYGKAATALFYPAVLLAWPWHAAENVRALGRALICVSVALSVLAAAHYTLDSVKKWKALKGR